MDDDEWVMKLKAGDEVATGNSRYGYRIEKVSKVTATQIVVGDSR